VETPETEVLKTTQLSRLVLLNQLQYLNKNIAESSDIITSVTNGVILVFKILLLLWFISLHDSVTYYPFRIEAYDYYFSVPVISIVSLIHQLHTSLQFSRII
jgi:hypothetical protein